jgi:hypothetical protein
MKFREKASNIFQFTSLFYFSVAIPSCFLNTKFLVLAMLALIPYFLIISPLIVSLLAWVIPTTWIKSANTNKTKIIFCLSTVSIALAILLMTNQTKGWSQLKSLTRLEPPKSITINSFNEPFSIDYSYNLSFTGDSIDLLKLADSYSKYHDINIDSILNISVLKPDTSFSNKNSSGRNKSLESMIDSLLMIPKEERQPGIKKNEYLCRTTKENLSFYPGKIKESCVSSQISFEVKTFTRYCFSNHTDRYGSYYCINPDFKSGIASYWTY